VCGICAFSEVAWCLGFQKKKYLPQHIFIQFLSHQKIFNQLIQFRLIHFKQIESIHIKKRKRRRLLKMSSSDHDHDDQHQKMKRLNETEQQKLGKILFHQTIASMINLECARVVASMRQNSKYAILQRQTNEIYGGTIAGSSATAQFAVDLQEDQMIDENELVQEFVRLRRLLFMENASSLEAGTADAAMSAIMNEERGGDRRDASKRLTCADFIQPFLKCIVSVETSGPVTSQALSAVHKILKRDLIFGLDSVEKAMVVRDISEAVTMSRFEATDPDHDDAVLCKILHVLIDCVGSPSGKYLSDDDVCDVLQACYRIGHQSGKESGFLRHCSRHAMREIAEHVALRLKENMTNESSENARLQKWRDQLAKRASAFEKLYDERLKQHNATTATMTTTSITPPRSPHHIAISPVHRDVNELSFDPVRGPGAIEDGGPKIDVGTPSSPPTRAPLEKLKSLPAPYGLPAALEIFKFACSLIEASSLATLGAKQKNSSGNAGGDGSNGESSSEVPVNKTPYRSEEAEQSLMLFGIELVGTFVDTIVVSSATNSNVKNRYPELFIAIQDDLCKALTSLKPTAAPPVAAAACGCFTMLYATMRSELKLQLEMFLRVVLIPLCAAGKNKSSSSSGSGSGGLPGSRETQRIALETVVDLCRQPHFVTDCYMSFDCDLSKPCVFEELVSTLSASAFPANGARLSGANALSVEGLLAIVRTVSRSTGESHNEYNGDSSMLLGENRQTNVVGTSSSSSVAENGTTAQLNGDADNGNTDEGDSPAALRDELRGLDPWEYVKASAAPSGIARARGLRKSRALKRRLVVAAEHFNRSPKKGIPYMQEYGLLPENLTAKAVAKFLKLAPGLDKEVVGEYLGDPKDFQVEVLNEYANLFNFESVTLDKALRTFLDGFKLPGEAQKISRILEAYAARYFGANPNSCADADSAYVLSYSIIMLNTDAHNKQVKKKMTLEQFVRNNRGTNGGKDWPKETLVSIFDSIVTDEIRLTDDAAPSLSNSAWHDVMRACEVGQGKFDAPPDEIESRQYDADVFSLVWAPTAAAVAVIFERATDEDVLESSVEAFVAVARIASNHRMTDVVDHLVATMCAFVTKGAQRAVEINPLRPGVALGEDVKTRSAAKAAFAVANAHGDDLRRGWCNVLDCVLHMRRLGVVPDDVAATPIEKGEEREPLTSNNFVARQKAAQSGSLFRSFSALLGGTDYDYSLEEEKARLPEPNDREKALLEKSEACARACKFSNLFADSKFLGKESLAHLVAALAWAAGDPAQPPQSSDDEDAALFCLDAMLSVCYRNKDRARLCLPRVVSHIKAIVGAATQEPTPLVERAIFELLRVVRRVLPEQSSLHSNEDIALSNAPNGVADDHAVDALRVLFSLEPQVADAFFERIAKSLNLLVRQCASHHIKTARGWDTICKLLAASSRHPKASASGFDALSFVMENGLNINVSNARALIECACAFVDSNRGGEERSIKALKLLNDANDALCERSKSADCSNELRSEILAGAWGDLAKELARFASEDERSAVRDDAVLTLQHTLLSAEAFDAPAEHWLALFHHTLTPLLKHASENVRQIANAVRSEDNSTAWERTATLIIACVSKSFLQYAAPMKAEDPEAFAPTWLAVLDRFAEAKKFAKGEMLTEAVIENAKNMALVLCKQEIVPYNEEDGDSVLYVGTWDALKKIDSSLTPAIVIN
jgi:golgi-specific brefeldin A-resistance guanine nucleotide exchange factor 1